MMQTGKHSGKVVIAVSEDAQANVVPVLPRKPAEVELDDKASYVLCGGFGGIGRSCAKMMVAHGARHLVFLSRSGASTPQAQSLVRGLQSKGVKVDDVKCDSTDQAQVRDFWRRCKIDGWNVRGLIQCAMVLRDKAIENLAFDEWSDVIRSKVDGTRNLHDILPKDLDFFIMLSSLSGVLGHPGQANVSPPCDRAAIAICTDILT
jgi:NAD(P)-dependent dehydrogenase (short-subunit alcohol dehydrogenase family)